MKDRILQVRKDQGFTQDEFAKRINLSKNFVWMIEKGERVPSDRTIRDICREFDINERWLRTGNGDMHTPPDDEWSKIAERLLEDTDDKTIKFAKAFLEVYFKLDAKNREAIGIFAEELINNLKEKE